MEGEFDIAQWVMSARAHAGMSQEALGERLGKTKGNISAWEKRRHKPSFKQMAHISAVTGWPLPKEITVRLEGDQETANGLIDPDVLSGLVAVLRRLSLPDQRIALAQLADFGAAVDAQGRGGALYKSK
jgi:transcriptional regulator with XRE-family HTH domain